MNKSEVEDWLEKAYPTYPTVVNELLIDCIPAPAKRQRKLRSLFDSAFYGRDSVCHGWLKWFAMNKLNNCARYEVQVLIPEELGRLGNGRGRILPKGHRWFVPPGWRIQRADVCNIETLIEVGVTSPRSLVEPLWCYVVKEVIWVPYTRQNLNKPWENFEQEVSAYSIKRSSSKRVSSDRSDAI